MEKLALILTKLMMEDNLSKMHVKQEVILSLADRKFLTFSEWHELQGQLTHLGVSLVQVDMDGYYLVNWHREKKKYKKINQDQKDRLKSMSIEELRKDLERVLQELQVPHEDKTEEDAQDESNLLLETWDILAKCAEREADRITFSELADKLSQNRSKVHHLTACKFVNRLHEFCVRKGHELSLALVCGKGHDDSPIEEYLPQNKRRRMNKEQLWNTYGNLRKTLAKDIKQYQKEYREQLRDELQIIG